MSVADNESAVAFGELAERLRRNYAREFEREWDEVPASFSARIKSAERLVLEPFRWIWSKLTSGLFKRLLLIWTTAGHLRATGHTLVARAQAGATMIAGRVKRVTPTRPAVPRTMSLLGLHNAESPAADVSPIRRPRIVVRIPVKACWQRVMQAGRGVALAARTVGREVIAHVQLLARVTGHFLASLVAGLRSSFAGRNLVSLLTASGIVLLAIVNLTLTVSLVGQPAARESLAPAASTAVTSALPNEPALVGRRRSATLMGDIELPRVRRAARPRSVPKSTAGKGTPSARAAPVGEALHESPEEAIGRDMRRPMATSAAETDPVPAPADGIYTASDNGVRPPIAWNRQVPSGSAAVAPAEQLMQIELVVGESGRVESVRLSSSSTRMHEVMMLSAAKAWRFWPAIRKGRPVKYRMQIPVPMTR